LLLLPQQLRQLGDVGRDPACLVLAKQLRRRSPAGFGDGEREIEMSDSKIISIVERVEKDEEENKMIMRGLVLMKAPPFKALDTAIRELKKRGLDRETIVQIVRYLIED
jgi:hypothetical protein